MERSRAQGRLAWRIAQAVSAATLLLLTGAAHAEQKGLWRKDEHYYPDRKEKQRKIDEAYQKTIKSQPVRAPATNDPWGGARAGETTQGK